MTYYKSLNDSKKLFDIPQEVFVIESKHSH